MMEKQNIDDERTERLLDNDERMKNIKFWQMLTNETEEGRKKLNDVRFRLYEAETKVITRSIEMYTKQNLEDWVPQNASKYNLLMRDDFEYSQGIIKSIETTNGCNIIEQERENAYKLALKELDEKIGDEEKRLLSLRRKREDSDNPIKTSHPNTFNEKEMSDVELGMEELESEIREREEAIKELKALKNGQETAKGWNDSILKSQNKQEKNALKRLRELRNEKYAHINQDEKKISAPGEWTPEAGPLYYWASEILAYIRVIEKRFYYYSRFDEYYRNGVGKENFDDCKIFVEKLIRELYVSHSNIVFEFAGELYDKYDEERDFLSLIESMARNWNTGINYLTIPSNEDLPELNVFFKECLSGSTKYVDCYCVYRNMMREAVNRQDYESLHCSFFCLLYSLGLNHNHIWWKGKAFQEQKFAENVLYKLLKTKNSYQFTARIQDSDKYLEGVDVLLWCKWNLLSEFFYLTKRDTRGRQLAKNMENMIVQYVHSGKQDEQYRACISAIAELFFYMRGEVVFLYAGKEGKFFEWHSISDFQNYINNKNNFASEEDFTMSINNIINTAYFELWSKKVEEE